MACFTAPLAVAAVAEAGRRMIRKGEGGGKWRERLGWLVKLNVGGSVLLAFEHVWHGEIIFSFPFLTAVRDGNTAEMLEEIATVGGAMAVLNLLVWWAMVAWSARAERRAAVLAAAKEG